MDTLASGPPTAGETPRLTYEIGRPTIEDIPRLLELYEEQYVLHHEDIDSVYYAPFTDEVRSAIKADLHAKLQEEEPHVFVARKEGTIIGFISFGMGENNYPDANIKKFGEIKEVLVTDRARSKRVGDALLEKTEAHFREMGMPYTALECSALNERALSFYARQRYIARQIVHYKSLMLDSDADSSPSG